MKKYKAARGAQFNDAKAQELGAFVEKFGGRLKPKQLVDAARPVKSPIHDLFNWDDDDAAERYRVWQARQHLSHLEIVVIIDGKKSDTKAFHSVTVEVEDDKPERAYFDLVTIRSSKDLSAKVIENALNELQGWRKRYAEYQQVFGGVFQAADAVLNGRKKPAKKRKLAKAR